MQKIRQCSSGVAQVMRDFDKKNKPNVKSIIVEWDNITKRYAATSTLYRNINTHMREYKHDLYSVRHKSTP